MNENIKILLDKVAGDEGLLAKFSACKSVDEAYDLAKELVGGFTKEEFTEAMTALSAAEDADISDEDLAAAAGGEGAEDTADFEIPESVEEGMELGTKISVIATKIGDSATVVGNSIAKSATVVGNSVAKSATEIGKSVSKASKEVGKVSKKVSKAMAI